MEGEEEEGRRGRRRSSYAIELRIGYYDLV